MTGFQKLLLTLCLLFFVACPLFDKDEDSQNTS